MKRAKSFMQDDSQDWLTLDQIAERYGLRITNIYPRVNALKTAGLIKWRNKPGDQRVIQVHKDSLQLVENALGISS